MLTQEDKDLLDHLGYEWWMFRATYDLLQTLPAQHDPVRNALIESMVIHGRGLTEFFYREPSNNYQDDLRAKNLGLPILDLKSEPILDEWYKDANKRIAHLSKKRFTNPLVEWQAATTRSFLEQRIEDVRRHLGKDMPTNWIGDYPTTSSLLNDFVHSARNETPGPIVGTGAVTPTEA